MKTTFSYDHYYKYQELSDCLNQLAETYPDLLDLKVNCTSEKGLKQYVAILGNRKTGNALDKPGFYIDGNIHAGEVTSSMCAMHTIDYLLSNYGSDQEVTALLDTVTVYVIPRISPDGAEAYLNSAVTLRSADRDYLVEKGGIKETDLDDDGVIRMMRIRSPYGAWKIDKDDPALMKLREPSDDSGDFYDIYPEGILEAYEGDENLKVRKDDWGLDFNRNFPYGWYPEGRQEGAGKYPLSNVETRAIADFVLAHPNIGGAAIGHTSGGIILCPPGTRPSAKAPAFDMRILKAIAKMGEEELGYKAINIFDTFLSSQEFYDSGALDDWLYETQGIPAYTMEFWDLAAKAGVPVKWDDPKKDDEEESLKRFAACLKWVKENAPQYYQDWQEYDHPTFGKVEIGGFNYKFTHQNPPEGYLLKEVEADTRFNIRFMKALPRLVIDDLKLEKISDDVYRLEFIVGNRGYLPTNLTDTAINIKAARPVEVCIDGAELISGQQVTKIAKLEGYSSTISGVFYYGNITTTANAAARKKLTYVFRAAKGTEVTVTAVQEKAGKIVTKITI